MTMEQVRGADLKRGDLVVTWYGTHIITAIKPHPRWSEMFPGSRARLLEFDEGKVTGMAADDTDRFEVLRPLPDAEATDA